MCVESPFALFAFHMMNVITIQNASVSILHSGRVCDGHAVVSGYFPLLLPCHSAGGLSGEETVRR